MRNEMGNNNTSGLREEDTTADEAQGKSVQELVNANVVKEENHVLPTKESKDYHEKVTGLDSDDPKGSGDSHDHNQTSDETDHTEVQPAADSPKAEPKSNEVVGEDNEFQPASSPNELDAHEEPTESNLEENVLGANSNQLEKQASFKKEEEKIMSTSPFVTISPSHDPESQDSVGLKFDQHELTENYADQSAQDSFNSLKPSENILGSSVAGITSENGQRLNTCLYDNLDGILVSGTNLDVEEKRGDLSEKEMTYQEDKMLSKEKVEVENEVGNDSSKTAVMDATRIPSDSRSDYREKCNEEFTSEMDCYGNNCSESQPEANLMANSLNSNIEQYVPEDKCMVITEETEFIRKESEREVNDHHYDLNQLSEDSISESEIELANASQSDSFLGPSVSHDPASNGSCQVEEAKVAENGYHIDLFNGIQSEASEDSCKESEGDTMIVAKLGMLPKELSISNRKGNEEEAVCPLEEEKPAEKHIVEEIKEKTEAPCAVGKGAEEQQRGEQFVSKSVSVQEEAYTPQAPQIIEEIKEKTEALRAVGKGAEEQQSGEQFVSKSVSVQEEAYTPQAPQIIEEIKEKTEALRAVGKGAEEQQSGEQFVSKSVSVQEEAYTPQAPQIIEEIKEKTEALRAVGKGAEEQQSGEQFVSKSVSVQEEAYTPQAPQIIEEIKEKTEALRAVGKGAEEQQSGEQFVSKSVSVQAEAYSPQAPASLFQSQDQQQETAKASGDAQCSKDLALELKPESCKESLVAKASTDQATSMNIVGNSASTVELAMDKPQQEDSLYVIAAPEIERETKSLAFEKCEKFETTIFPKGAYEAQESVGRLSTESNPDNLNIHVQMRKSPSFDLDLRIEARSEETDQTPLLYQDKTTIESSSNQADVSLQSPRLIPQYNQESLRAMPVEEKVINLERSDSEKSRTPFLGGLKEDEEAHVLVTPTKQDNHAAAKKAAKDLWNSPTKEVASASPKGKEKHKRRTSLFGQCMCCATVIN